MPPKGGVTAISEIDTSALNKKLAEWVGFTPAHPSCGNPNHMIPPRGTLYDGCAPIPRFSESLDACIKWLVPGLADFSLAKHQFGEYFAFASITTDNPTKVYISRMGQSKEPALALCLAIEKLIDSQEAK